MGRTKACGLFRHLHVDHCRRVSEQSDRRLSLSLSAPLREISEYGREAAPLAGLSRPLIAFEANSHSCFVTVTAQTTTS
jgi:hypothetical protein